MKIPKVIEQMGKMCTVAYSDFSNSLDELNKRCEIQNRIAILSSYDFVRAFNYTADAICARRTTPNTETYLSLGEKAIELLASGKEQADVVYYFDELLRKENEGK